jgi:hypothetical protein
MCSCVRGGLRQDPGACWTFVRLGAFVRLEAFVRLGAFARLEVSVRLGAFVRLEAFVHLQTFLSRLGTLL